MHNNLWEMLPAQFIERLETITPAEKLQSVLQSFCVEKPITFRTNTLLTTTQAVNEALKKENINATQVDWYTDAFVLEKGQSKETLTQSKLCMDGHIYIQSLSSMIPPLVLDPKPRQIICDLTAAPGSKTTQMAALMHNEGTIVANDTSKPRLFKLQANLKQQGVTNTRTMSFPGQAVWKRYPEFFDAVLVDVPCTMEGRFSALDPKTYTDWKPKKAKSLSQLQKYLLRSAVSATKPGGSIVYATCTMEPEENELVIDWLLAKEKDKVVLEDIILPIPEMLPGLLSWKNKNLSVALEKTKRILPSATMEGFYVAKLRKRLNGNDM